MRFILATLNLLGYSVARWCLYPITCYFVITGRNSRNASADYFARLNRFDPAAPKPSLLTAFRHHLEFAHHLLERALLWKGDSSGFRFSTSGKELLEKNRKTGCLLVGAHMGSFDVLRILSMKLATPVNIVMRRFNARRVNRIFEELNPQANLHVIELEEDNLAGMLEIKERLERGEHVAILADRLAPNQSQRISKVSFLGEEAPFPQNPWLIAKLVGCPVLLVAALRTANRCYNVTIETLAESPSSRSNSVDDRIRDFAARLESLCLHFPTQWFNFYDFWSAPNP